jgi:hypothetical protein
MWPHEGRVTMSVTGMVQGVLPTVAGVLLAPTWSRRHGGERCEAPLAPGEA